VGVQDVLTNRAVEEEGELFFQLLKYNFKIQQTTLFLSVTEHLLRLSPNMDPDKKDNLQLLDLHHKTFI
jgi:hypothetical protein